MPKPNIVFIFSDQQRHDTLGCYGQSLEVSPRLDAMATEGVRFSHAFTPQPVCGPARACLQTGRYATETGCFRNDIALPRDADTLPRYMKGAGYRTGYIGKWHLASAGLRRNYRTRPVPEERRGGWDDFWLAADVLEFTSTAAGGHLFNADMEKVAFPGYRVDAMTDFALDFIRDSAGRDEPFFLFLSFLEPHHQNTSGHHEGPEGSRERFDGFDVPPDLQGTAGDWRREYPDYLGSCRSLDENAGRILDCLESLGILDETLVIYTSDHGSHFRTRNSEYKRSCHDNSLRVPLLVRGPGFPQGVVDDRLVSLMDLPPTLLCAAGIGVPGRMRGRPLQEALDDRSPWPESVYIQISESQTGRAIRTDRWKYSVRSRRTQGFIHPGSPVYIEDCLYDLDADPAERNNLVRDPGYRDVRAGLSGRLRAMSGEVGDPIRRILPRTRLNILRESALLPLNLLSAGLRRLGGGT